MSTGLLNSKSTRLLPLYSHLSHPCSTLALVFVLTERDAVLVPTSGWKGYRALFGRLVLPLVGCRKYACVARAGCGTRKEPISSTENNNTNQGLRFYLLYHGIDITPFTTSTPFAIIIVDF